jgi:hypothetical protein
MPQDVIITAYKFDELSDDAKDKAREWYRNINDMPELKGDMLEALKELLADNKITFYEDPTVYYSLGYCQGDGACFIGKLYHDGYAFRVTSEGRYCHSNTMAVEFLYQAESGVYGLRDDDSRDMADVEGAFLDLCKSIADKLEDIGYKHIEAENSDENVDEVLRINDYLFTEAGKRCACL